MTGDASAIKGFDGPQVAPGDPDYDDLRAVFNGMIDRRPSSIARCATVDDVVAVVNHGRDNGLRPERLRRRALGDRIRRVATTAVVLDLRPLDHGDRGRRGADGPRPGRGHVGRRRRSDDGARARGDRRPGELDRRRRPDARLGQRMARADVRPHLRQPALVPGRPRGRFGRQRQRPRRTRSCSGGCVEGAATSAWSPSSSSPCTRSRRCSTPVSSSTLLRRGADLLQVLA